MQSTNSALLSISPARPQSIYRPELTSAGSHPIARFTDTKKASDQAPTSADQLNNAKLVQTTDNGKGKGRETKKPAMLLNGTDGVRLVITNSSTPHKSALLLAHQVTRKAHKTQLTLQPQPIQQPLIAGTSKKSSAPKYSRVDVSDISANKLKLAIEGPLFDKNGHKFDRIRYAVTEGTTHTSSDTNAQTLTNLVAIICHKIETHDFSDLSGMQTVSVDVLMNGQNKQVALRQLNNEVSLKWGDEEWITIKDKTTLDDVFSALDEDRMTKSNQLVQQLVVEGSVKIKENLSNPTSFQPNTKMARTAARENMFAATKIDGIENDHSDFHNAMITVAALNTVKFGVKVFGLKNEGHLKEYFENNLRKLFANENPEVLKNLSYGGMLTDGVNCFTYGTHGWSIQGSAVKGTDSRLLHGDFNSNAPAHGGVTVKNHHIAHIHDYPAPTKDFFYIDTLGTSALAWGSPSMK